jgi:phytoene desaturase
LERTKKMTQTIVIGGGIAGLATAGLLAREGHQVTLLERLDQFGGRVGTLERDGFRFDTGPSWYLMPRVFDHFFELMGTSTSEQLDLHDLQPAYRIFSEPSAAGNTPDPVTIPRGAKQVEAVFAGLEPGSAQVLETYLDSARKTTDMAEQFFLYNPFTRLSSLLKRPVLGSLPKLVSLLTTSLEAYVAKRFTHPVLRQVLGYPAVFLGTNPSDAPAMYHLMSALDLDEGVQYPMGGFSQIVERLEHLARAAGATLITGADVTEIMTDPSGSSKKSQVTGVRWRDSEGVEHEAAADIVVSGADLHHTETALLSAPNRSYPEQWWQEKISGPGAVLVLLGVKGELPELAHHSLLFASDWHKNFDDIFGKNPAIPDPASIYICKPSASDPGVAPAGHENLFILVPIPAEPQIGAGGPDGAGDQRVEQTADAVIEQIATWANIPDFADRIVVRHTIGPADFASDYNSWRGGMLGPAHTLRQSAMFRPQNASKKVQGLYYAGSTTSPGVGVPMCLISAELVLKRVRGDHSAGPLPTTK